MPGVDRFDDYDRNLNLKGSGEMWLVVCYLLRPYLILLSTCRPGAPAVVRKLWLRGKPLLLLAAMPDILMIFMPVITGIVSRIHVLGWTRVGLACVVIACLLKSARGSDTFAGFPEQKTPAGSA